jgi:cell division protein FtsA
MVLGRPQGMKGMKLEARTLFITCLEQHLNDLIQTFGDAGIEVEDVMAVTLAASLVTLSKTQKIAGCVLANIGAETVSIVVPLKTIFRFHLKYFPSDQLTLLTILHLGLKMTLEEAEILKLGGTNHDITYSKKKLEEIVDARLSDIFELIETHLKRIGRSGLLPAGIVMTGGGAQTANIELAAKASLRLPARLATTGFEGDTRAYRRPFGRQQTAFVFSALLRATNRPSELKSPKKPKTI